jgi:predicted regulator of Ras-like GTPase activity (Roadblock/LC7/MglB family)
MFRETLQQMVDGVEGGVAGLLMGFDGIAVDSYTRSAASLDIQTIGMELSPVLKQARRAAEILEVGDLAEMTLRTGEVVLLIRAISEDYFLALALSKEGNFGKGRYLARLAAPKMRAEM